MDYDDALRDDAPVFDYRPISEFIAEFYKDMPFLLDGAEYRPTEQELHDIGVEWPYCWP